PQCRRDPAQHQEIGRVRWRSVRALRAWGKRSMKRSLALLGVAFLGSCASPQQSTSLKIALTIDDLPLHAPYPPGDTPDSVAAGVSGALVGLPAYGFVNAHWVGERPDTAHVLPGWREAGLSLGNHGWMHRHLSEMTLPQFEDELVRNEAVLEET